MNKPKRPTKKVIVPWGDHVLRGRQQRTVARPMRQPQPPRKPGTIPATSTLRVAALLMTL